MRYLLPLLLLLGGCGGCASLPSHDELRATALRLEFAGGLCSGTAVGPQTILTATHCLNLGVLKSVNGKPATTVEVKIEGGDAAVITIAGIKLKHIAKRGPRPVQGQRLRWFGNPSGHPDVYRQGYVARAWTNEILIDAVVCRGDSGAGLLDEAGRVVGVVSAMTSEAGCHFGLAL